MVSKVPKKALKYLKAESATELVKAKAVTDTSGERHLLLVKKDDLKWARKVHSNLKGYIIQTNVQYEHPDKKVGQRGSRDVWVYGPSVRLYKPKKRTVKK
jgi:hypothetical protein